MSCLLVLWCFSPWFCKFSRLVCSVKRLYVESIFYHVSNVFMDFNLDYLQYLLRRSLKFVNDRWLTVYQDRVVITDLKRLAEYFFVVGKI